MKFLIALLFFLLSSISVSGQVDSTLFNRTLDAFHQYKFQDINIAGQYLQKLDSLTKGFPNTSYRCSYLITLGGWHHIRREILKSTSAYTEAVKLAEKLQSEDLLIKAKFNLSSSYGEGGDLPNALRLLQEVDEIIKKTDTPSKHVEMQKMIYFNLVRCYTALGDFNKAYVYSNIVFKKMESKQDSMMYYLTRLVLNNDAKHFQENITLGEKSLKVLDSKDLQSAYQVNSLLGIAFVRIKRPEEAGKYLKVSKSISRTLGIVSPDLELCIGEMYLYQNLKQKAIVQFEEALKLARQQNDLEVLMEANSGLYRAYKAQNNYKTALEYKEYYNILKDSLQGLQVRKHVSKLETAYNVKEKERTIAQQKKENQLHQERRTTLLVLLFISILFLGFAIYLLRKIRKNNERIFRQRNKIIDYANRLEEANKMRDKLFAIIGHDLRSPISSLSNTLSLYNEEKKSKLLENTLLSLSNIQLILNNLLKWANLQITSSKPVYTEVNIEVLLESIIKQVKTPATAKSIHIITDYNHTQEARTDEHYLQIALRNILTNAVKFTPEQGGIRVSTRENSEGIAITIRDSGVGIPADSLSGLFNYPISKEGTAGEKGTGLGLSLTKELIEKVSGKITVKSKPGIGTEVTILLPVKRTEAMEEVVSLSLSKASKAT